MTERIETLTVPVPDPAGRNSLASKASGSVSDNTRVVKSEAPTPSTVEGPSSRPTVPESQISQGETRQEGVDELQSQASQSNRTDNVETPRRDFKDRVKIGLHWKKASEDIESYNYKIGQIIRTLDEFPSGYGKLAALQDCDPNFLIFKRFGWLHIRVLLHVQDELVVLQDKLEKYDEIDARNDITRLYSRRKDESIDSVRKDLLKEIFEKLALYDETLLRIEKLYMLRNPAIRDQTSVFNFIDGTESQNPTESEWIHNRDDLVSLASRHERTWLHDTVEILLRTISRTALLYFFRTKNQNIRTGKGSGITVNLVSAERIDWLVSAIITVLATVLLLIPIAILYIMQGDRGLTQIAVIFAAILVFAGCIATLTKAKRSELFSATAAYAAVLVVFLGTNKTN